MAYGTSELKLTRRAAVDLIVQKSSDVVQFGLRNPTRFDLDCLAVLPWHPVFFGCWAGYSTPKIGSLNEEFVKEYAYLMLKRQSV
jgi:hypothetical protein